MCEGILINLLVSCFRRALVIVLVRRSANASHADASHSRYRDAAIGTGLDDTLLANLELGKGSLVVDPCLSSVRETARWVVLRWLWSRLASDVGHGLLLLLMLDQVAQVLHLLLVQLVHVGVRELSLMVHAA